MLMVTWFNLFPPNGFSIIYIKIKCKGAFTQYAVLLQHGAALRCLAALLIGSSWFQQASLHWRAAVWQCAANWVHEPIYGTAAAAAHVLELIRQLAKLCPAQKHHLDRWQQCRCRSQTAPCVKGRSVTAPWGSEAPCCAAAKQRPV